MPNLEKRKPPVSKLPITLICDNVREPGNLGSILRIAAAIPVERVILLAGNLFLFIQNESKNFIFSYIGQLY